MSGNEGYIGDSTFMPRAECRAHHEAVNAKLDSMGTKMDDFLDTARPFIALVEQAKGGIKTVIFILGILGTVGTITGVVVKVLSLHSGGK